MGGGGTGDRLGGSLALPSTGGSIVLTGIGGKGVDCAGDNAEAGKGGNDAGLLAKILGIARAVPEVLELLDLMVELIGGQAAREAGLLLLFQFGLDWKCGGQPEVHLLDDLADAGLREAVLCGEGTRGNMLDEVGAMDVEIAKGRWKGGWW